MKIPNHAIEHLIILLRKFKGLSYGEFEAMKKPMFLLNEAFNNYVISANEDQKEFERLWNEESSLEKKDLAWLTKNEFKDVLSNTSFIFEEIEVLERWIIKD